MVVNKWQDRWQSSSQAGTSRAVFSAFCDALRSQEDPKTGGAPQVVGLYRKGTGRCFGVVSENNKFILGLLIDHNPDDSLVEWRNTLFERCGSDGKRIKTAQVHHAPKGLGDH